MPIFNPESAETAAEFLTRLLTDWYFYIDHSDRDRPIVGRLVPERSATGTAIELSFSEEGPLLTILDTAGAWFVESGAEFSIQPSGKFQEFQIRNPGGSICRLRRLKSQNDPLARTNFEIKIARQRMTDANGRGLES